MLERVQEYKWQCSECKTCLKCSKKVDADKMLYCDQCDRGYHIYCIGLRNVPEGKWFFGNFYYWDLGDKLF
jgi:BRG1-associated factor 45A